MSAHRFASWLMLNFIFAARYRPPSAIPPLLRAV